MSISRRCLWALVVVLLLFVLGAKPLLAVAPNRSLVNPAWLWQHRFPMQEIGHFDVTKVPAHLPFGMGGALATTTDNGAVSISGKAKDGTAWDVTIGGGYCMDYFDLSVADLDKNGQQDAMFTFRLDSTGIEEGFEHLFLLFDANGLPMPNVGVSWGMESSDRNVAIVDLDEDGHAEMFDQEISSNRWQFHVYRADNARWHRVSHWPASDKNAMPKLSTRQFIPAGRLLSSSEEEDGNTLLTLADPAGTTSSMRLCHWSDRHCIMVIATPQHRRILFSNAHRDQWRQTLREIASAPNQLFVAGDLGTAWESKKPAPAPMMAWFSVGSPAGAKP